jgi:glycosyltransferase involved in cell wall biosynthesis
VSLLVLSRGEITRDPRAWRVVAAAERAGIGVQAICVADAPPGSAATAIVTRLSPGSITSIYRGRQTGGPPNAQRSEFWLIRELRGAFRLARLARTTTRFYRAGRRVTPNVIHAHDLDTLPAGWLLARRHGARLIYDAHELYSDQDPGTSRVEREVGLLLERFLARKADVVVTVGDCIGREIALRLRLKCAHLVVLNAPRREDVRMGEPSGDAQMRVVYQGAMGPGRLVDDLFDAATSLHGVELTLRVAGIPPATLESKALARGLDGMIRVLPPVPPVELIQALAPFEVGLIINRPVTRNDELVFPNKLFEYMMAGLAVVAPRLPELTRLIDGERVGLTFEPGDPHDLARALNELASDRPRLETMRRRARELALERYNAEAQEPVLLEAWGL